MNHQHPIQMDLAAYAAGRLEESSRRRVAEHLAQCEVCRRMVESVSILAEVLHSDGEALFAPHPSGEELREFSKKGAAGSSERIAGHLEVCASCALEVDAWSRMSEKGMPFASPEGIPERRAGATGAGKRVALAAAAGIVVGITLGYLAREGLPPPKSIPPPMSRPQPPIESKPPESLLRIGPQLLLPRLLRGESSLLVYMIQPRQEAMVIACPASIPESVPSDARFRFELSRQGGQAVWSQEMTASAIREHRERTGVVTLLMRTGILEPGRYDFKLVGVDGAGGPLYRTPLEFTRPAEETP